MLLATGKYPWDLASKEDDEYYDFMEGEHLTKPPWTFMPMTLLKFFSRCLDAGDNSALYTPRPPFVIIMFERRHCHQSSRASGRERERVCVLRPAGCCADVCSTMTLPFAGPA